MTGLIEFCYTFNKECILLIFAGAIQHTAEPVKIQFKVEWLMHKSQFHTPSEMKPVISLYHVDGDAIWISACKGLKHQALQS